MYRTEPTHDVVLTKAGYVAIIERRSSLPAHEGYLGCILTLDSGKSRFIPSEFMATTRAQKWVIDGFVAKLNR